MSQHTSTDPSNSLNSAICDPERSKTIVIEVYEHYLRSDGYRNGFPKDAEILVSKLIEKRTHPSPTDTTSTASTAEFCDTAEVSDSSDVPTFVLAAMWLEGGSYGGFTFDGIQYSPGDCYCNGLCILADPGTATDLRVAFNLWCQLMNVGCGVVNGVSYDRRDCACQVLETFEKIPHTTTECISSGYQRRCENASIAWRNLVDSGGGTVGGQYFSPVQCTEQAVTVCPLRADPWAWHNLGVFGGGTVGGIRYSQRDCFLRVLSVDPLRSGLWTWLASNGGGILNGVMHEPKDCVLRILRHQAEFEAKEKITPTCLAQNVSDAWAHLGCYGGGIVDDRYVSPAECHNRAATIYPARWDVWLNLAALGGGTVDGTNYTELQCFLRCLNLRTFPRAGKLQCCKRICGYLLYKLKQPWWQLRQVFVDDLQFPLNLAGCFSFG